MKIKKMIINIIKKSQFFRSLLRGIHDFSKKIKYKRYSRKLDIDEKMFIFESFMGRTYSDNPKALYEEIIKNPEYDDYTLVWAFKKPISKQYIQDLSRAVLVKYNSLKYVKYYCQAKYIVSNSRIPEYIKPKKGQVYIQTWHGTPLKRLGYDLTTEGGNALNSLKDMQNKYKADAERYTYLLSPSKFCTEKFTSCFNLKENNPECEIIEQGYPRNDFLTNYTQDAVTAIKYNLGINELKNKKIILYAPTWRDNQHTSGVGYTYEVDVDFDLLQKELGEDYIILFRAHYFVANSFDFNKYRGFIYDVSKYENINDLYVISDILITDYSSVFFDYAILKRPIIFYMYDLKAYQEDIRGFYIDLKDLPGNIVEKEDELITEIKNVTNKFEYDERYKAFNDRFTYLDDGQVSKRVIEHILKNNNEKE